MSEKTPKGQETSEQQNEILSKEEDPLAKVDDNKGLSQGSEAIAVVKSKIREKTAPEDSKEKQDGSEKLGKMSNTKLSKIASKRGKRSKSKSSEALEVQEPAAEELKTGQLLSDNPPPDQVTLESKMKIDMSTISKKSVSPSQPMSKSSRRLGSSEDRRDENIQPKPSDVKSTLNADAQSTFVISHDVEPSREENTESVPPNPEELSRRLATQRHVHERGNYMNSVSPSPIEDYKPDPENRDEQN